MKNGGGKEFFSSTQIPNINLVNSVFCVVAASIADFVNPYPLARAVVPFPRLYNCWYVPQFALPLPSLALNIFSFQSLFNYSTLESTSLSLFAVG